MTKTTVHLGYTSYNHALNLSSGRTVRSRRKKDGSLFPRALAQAKVNLDCVTRILGWNLTNEIRYFRLNDEFIPRLTMFGIESMQYELEQEIEELRSMADEAKSRIALHVTDVAFAGSDEAWELTKHRLIRRAELLEVLHVRDSIIECHIGQPFGGSNFETIVQRLKSLPMSVLGSLSFENDHQWGPNVTAGLCGLLMVPFTYDVFHHWQYAHERPQLPDDIPYLPSGIAYAVERCSRSWGSRPATIHVSSQAALRPTGVHADYVTFDDYARIRRVLSNVGGSYRVVVEAGQTDKAVLQLRSLVSGRVPEWAVRDENGQYI